MSQLIYYFYCTTYIMVSLLYKLIMFYPQGIVLAIFLLLLIFISLHIYALALNDFIKQILYLGNAFEYILYLFNTFKNTKAVVVSLLNLFYLISYQWASYWLIYKIKKLFFYLFWLSLVLQLVSCLWLQQLKF